MVGVPAIYAAAWLILLLAGCDPRQSDQVDQRSSAGQEPVGRSEDAVRSPASQLELLAQFNRAAALMEQYKYAEAAKGFERVVETQPHWTAAEFNLGLAYLNMQGVQGAEAHLDNAEAVFQSLLADDPDFAAARFCLGLLYHHQGEMEKSLEQFRAAYQLDPKDPYVVYQYARALADVGRSAESIEVFEQVLRLDPGFVSAVYGLARQYQRTRQKEKTLELLERFQKLNADELTGGSYTVRNVYGSAGKYYRVLGPDALPVSSQQTEQTLCAVFSPDVRQLPSVLAVWDAENARIETPGAAAGDFDQDGDLDLCLTSVDSAGTCRLWINDGEGHFALGPVLADGVISPSMGDVDNDGDLDLWLGRAGRDRLLENDGRGNFANAAPSLSTLVSTCQCSRLVDVDSDGDLDFLSFGMEGGTPANSVLNNNRDGTFQEIAENWDWPWKTRRSLRSCMTILTTTEISTL
jgi:tetratricopeptide (TPR) repeat protein